MAKRKGSTIILLAIVVGVIILAMSLIPIPSNVRYVIQYILVGVFVSGGIIGWKPAENKRNIIIANIILWCGIIAAIVILFI
ncbi:MAG: hypothetical protein P9X24_18280 [Candidatus Hatepunaea meridiana]|nr:hypothetical protein [Candidatus Hatepunaea meridiana]